MAELVNLIPLIGLKFMRAYGISTTLLSMTKMMMTSLASVKLRTKMMMTRSTTLALDELSVFVFCFFAGVVCMLHAAKIIVTCYNRN